MHERTPYGPALHPLTDVSEPDAYGAAIGWQDKSGSPVAIQAIDIACLSPCRMVGPRAASRQKANDFNDICGTVPVFGHSASCVRLSIRLEICILEWYTAS